MKNLFLLFLLSVVLCACSSDYQQIVLTSTINNILQCSSKQINETCQKFRDVERDSHGRIRYAKISGNNVYVYWHPYQYEPSGILALRVQNKDDDKWYSTDLSELSFFKAIFVQAYGNAFSNMVLGPITGLFADSPQDIQSPKASVEQDGNKFIGYWADDKGFAFEVLTAGEYFIIRNINGDLSADLVNNELKGENAVGMEFFMRVDGNTAYYDFSGVVTKFQRISKGEYDNMVSKLRAQ